MKMVILHQRKDQACWVIFICHMVGYFNFEKIGSGGPLHQHQIKLTQKAPHS